MTVDEVARAFADLCKADKHLEAGEQFWADDVVSLEAWPGDMARCAGRAAVRAKSDWWYANHEVHSAETFGPYVHGDQFALRFVIDVTPKGGERLQMEEIGLYSVRNGKVVEERFFY